MSKLSDLWFRFLSKLAFFLIMQFFVLMDAASHLKLRLKATRLRITAIQYLKLIEKKNPTIRYTTEGMEHLKPVPGECRVCLSEFDEGEKLRKLKCNHTYHKECLDTWLQRWPTCPLCRSKVLPEDIVAKYKHEQVEAATLESEGSEDIPFLVGLFTWW